MLGCLVLENSIVCTFIVICQFFVPVLPAFGWWVGFLFGEQFWIVRLDLLGFGFFCSGCLSGKLCNGRFCACCVSVFYGEFDPGSGRTLAACLTHASRTMKPVLARVEEWRT